MGVVVHRQHQPDGGVGPRHFAQDHAHLAQGAAGSPKSFRQAVSQQAGTVEKLERGNLEARLPVALGGARCNLPGYPGERRMNGVEPRTSHQMDFPSVR
jgi:hypothetical protein